MKRVSVVVPVYGVESYIAATIQSVLQQTYSQFELILVDDGGRDRSLEICRQFADPRIRMISQENRGLAGARNTGIRHAQGEYLAFLDGDDLWRSDKLERHIAHLERYPQVGVSFSRSALIDETGQSLNTYLMPKLQGITVSDLFRVNPIGNGSAAVIRRQTLEDIRFQANLHGIEETFYFDEQFRRAEDIECWLRIAIQTDWEIAGIPEALTFYRVNSGGLSAQLESQLNAWKQVLVKVKTYAPDLVQKFGTLSLAYRLRYLSRSAIRLKLGWSAVQLMNRALLADGRIVLEDPKRTLRIAIAAYLLWLIPQPIYRRLENLAAQWAGRLQKRQIQQEVPSHSI